MSTTKAEKIEVTSKGGKVLVDIDLAACACTFDLTVGECVVLIEKLTHAVLDPWRSPTGTRPLPTPA